MKKINLRNYRCPYTIKELLLKDAVEDGDVLLEGILVNNENEKFFIKEGIPDFTYPKELSEIEQKTKTEYEEIAERYDSVADFPFRTFGENEDEIRNAMIDMLNIKPGDYVLEIGCGSGRGSLILAERLKGYGKLFLQELSPSFLNIAIEKFKESSLDIEFSIANGCYLPFPDNYFNCAHHFGGLNVFADIKRSLKELARVVRPGGKVVIGDESIAPWLRNTELGKIVINANPMYAFNFNMTDIPLNAYDVNFQWIMKGAFYLITFTVGEGEPKADYHVPIPGKRGGTLWSRYYGQMEGITDETKKMAYQAQEKSGLSMSDWLDKAIKTIAIQELNA